MTCPRIDWRTRRSSPAPWHSGHRVAEVPGRAPVPSQVSQWTGVVTSTWRCTPKTASRKVSRTTISASGPGVGPAAPRPAPRRAAHAVEEGVEQVAEPPAPNGSPPAAAPAPGPNTPGRAETVVAGPSFGVAQHLVGQADLLELLAGVAVALVGVGMVLPGLGPVGALQLVVGGVAARRRGARRGRCRSPGRPRRGARPDARPPPGPPPGPAGSSSGWGRAGRWCPPPSRRPTPA